MIFSPFFFFTQGFKWEGVYYQGQQLPGPEGAPQGFVREERDDDEWYYNICEYVDGKVHGHDVCYDGAGNLTWESDYLLNEYCE